LSRSGVLALSVSESVPTGKVLFAVLEPVCRKGGQQIFLTDGLDRFMDASRRFVQRLLRLSRRQDPPPVTTESKPTLD
jgi:hypothetical protein